MEKPWLLLKTDLNLNLSSSIYKLLKTFLVVQRLRLHISNAGGDGSIPDGRPKIPHGMQCGHKIKKSKSKFLKIKLKFKKLLNPSVSVSQSPYLQNGFHRSVRSQLDVICKSFSSAFC